MRIARLPCSLLRHVALPTRQHRAANLSTRGPWKMAYRGVRVQDAPIAMRGSPFSGGRAAAGAGGTAAAGSGGGSCAGVACRPAARAQVHRAVTCDSEYAPCDCCESLARAARPPLRSLVAQRRRSMCCLLCYDPCALAGHLKAAGKLDAARCAHASCDCMHVPQLTLPMMMYVIPLGSKIRCTCSEGSQTAGK
jgi:hypothetical protein